MNMKKLAVAVLLSLGLASTAVYADGGNFLELGLGVNVYGTFDDIADLDNTALALDARWGTLGNTGLYAWGSYEQPDVYLGNLNLGELRMFGVGAGWRLPMGDRFYSFVEGGYYLPWESASLDPITFSNEFGGSVGVGFDITENFTMDAGYRYLKVDQTSPWNVQSVDLSAWTIGASIRF